MFEKKAIKRKFCVVLSVLVLCLSLFPLTAFAEWKEPLDYQELDYKVKYGSDYNAVTVPLPSDNYYFTYLDDAGLRDNQYGSPSFVIPGVPGDNIRIRVYPASSFGVSLDNIPDGSKLTFDIELTEFVSDQNGYVDYEFPSVNLIGYYLVKQAGKWVWKDTEVVGRISETPFGGKYTCEFVIQPHSYDVYGFVPLVEFNDFRPLTDSLFKIEIVSAVLDMQISADYWQQWQNEQNGQMLNSMNDKLDNLPGQIGDEFENALENEKETAKGEGNKFVNQILDKLPDPSTKVLTALKSLTDAMSYTGTDAILTIPPLVMPAIGDIVPRTEIWEGANFSFGDYIDVMPEKLVVVVQSLFTIAIVLFCVYELKGLISYCLTLNDKKGG